MALVSDPMGSLSGITPMGSMSQHSGKEPQQGALTILEQILSATGRGLAAAPPPPSLGLSPSSSLPARTPATTTTRTAATSAASAGGSVVEGREGVGAAPLGSGSSARNASNAPQRSIVTPLSAAHDAATLAARCPSLRASKSFSAANPSLADNFARAQSSKEDPGAAKVTAKGVGAENEQRRKRGSSTKRRSKTVHPLGTFDDVPAATPAAAASVTVTGPASAAAGESVTVSTSAKALKASSPSKPKKSTKVTFITPKDSPVLSKGSSTKGAKGASPKVGATSKGTNSPSPKGPKAASKKSPPATVTPTPATVTTTSATVTVTPTAEAPAGSTAPAPAPKAATAAPAPAPATAAPVTTVSLAKTAQAGAASESSPEAPTAGGKAKGEGPASPAKPRAKVRRSSTGGGASSAAVVRSSTSEITAAGGSPKAGSPPLKRVKIRSKTSSPGAGKPKGVSEGAPAAASAVAAVAGAKAGEGEKGPVRAPVEKVQKAHTSSPKAGGAPSAPKAAEGAPKDTPTGTKGTPKVSSRRSTSGKGTPKKRTSPKKPSASVSTSASAGAQGDGIAAAGEVSAPPAKGRTAALASGPAPAAATDVSVLTSAKGAAAGVALSKAGAGGKQGAGVPTAHQEITAAEPVGALTRGAVNGAAAVPVSVSAVSAVSTQSAWRPASARAMSPLLMGGSMYAARPGKGASHSNSVRPGGRAGVRPQKRKVVWLPFMYNKVVSRMCFVAVQGGRDGGGRLGEGGEAQESEGESDGEEEEGARKWWTSSVIPIGNGGLLHKVDGNLGPVGITITKASSVVEKRVEGQNRLQKQVNYNFSVSLRRPRCARPSASSRPRN